MTPADRARQILAYLAANNVAGTPEMVLQQLEIFHAIDRHSDLSVDTVRRRLKDFAAVGYVERLPDYGHQGYYRATAAGRFRMDDEITDEELEAIIGARNRD
jgi:DNA-binding IclR family transcriptional regulator